MIVMKKLSDVVNVVPVIAKSDCLTLEERERFKLKVWHLAITRFCFFFVLIFVPADQGRTSFQQH